MPLNENHQDFAAGVVIVADRVQYRFYVSEKKTVQNRRMGYARKICRNGNPSKMWSWAVERADGSIWVAPEKYADIPCWALGKVS